MNRWFLLAVVGLLMAPAVGASGFISESRTYSPATMGAAPHFFEVKEGFGPVLVEGVDAFRFHANGAQPRGASAVDDNSPWDVTVVACQDEDPENGCSLLTGLVATGCGNVFLDDFSPDLDIFVSVKAEPFARPWSCRGVPTTGSLVIWYTT